MAKKSKFPVVPALIGLGFLLLFKKKNNPPPRTVMDVLPSTQANVLPNSEVEKAVRGQL